jgi:hypothetical protein
MAVGSEPAPTLAVYPGKIYRNKFFSNNFTFYRIFLNKKLTKAGLTT